jgi:hypothetical protein
MFLTYSVRSNWLFRMSSVVWYMATYSGMPCLSQVGIETHSPFWSIACVVPREAHVLERALGDGCADQERDENQLNPSP